LGVSGKTVSKWENGSSAPTLELLAKLAHYYNVSVDKLLGLEGKTSGSMEEQIARLFAGLDRKEAVRQAFQLVRTILPAGFEAFCKDPAETESAVFPVDSERHCLHRVASPEIYQYSVSSEEMNLAVMLLRNRADFSWMQDSACSRKITSLFAFLSDTDVLSVCRFIHSDICTQHFTADFVAAHIGVAEDKVKAILDASVGFELCRRIKAQLAEGEAVIYETDGSGKLLTIISLAYQHTCDDSRGYAYHYNCRMTLMTGGGYEMSFSQNVKRLRTERKLTQEQLAEALGVSAQAISKWETSETYPDGSLLVPLAQRLEVSLDELFDNRLVSMRDLSLRIAALLKSASEAEKFPLVRDLCWQVEKGLFNRLMPIDMTYDPKEAENEESSSYILDDHGFTLMSNSDTPFFAVFPKAKEGYGGCISAQDRLRDVFEAIAYPKVMEAVSYLFEHDRGYVFEAEVLARVCNISEEETQAVMERLCALGMVYPRALSVNGKERVFFQNTLSHKLLALFILARELCYNGHYVYQSHQQNAPFFKQT
ncbi:MAG: helix-turn-helix transcriptional regulator, partial [Clostridia bacterium]|nr:helix-turn-helix transcriptional regulator [Clostridia bacterium]